MRRIRVIPSLLLKNQGLVKTKKFRNPVYVGDPMNALRIFNEKEVDELALLDISETRFQAPLDIGFIRDVVSEAFMPISFGGGISTLQRMEELLKMGVEKVVLNSALKAGQALLKEGSAQFGAQSIVASMDVKSSLLRGYGMHINNGKERLKSSIVDLAHQYEDWGAGEILLNNIDREGTYQGYDLKLIELIASAVDIPVIASGGASNLSDFKSAREQGASAVSAGSMFVFQRPNQAVLITYPNSQEIGQISM
jgi:imidazole glycerol-phosphate synthase subunit HisF